MKRRESIINGIVRIALCTHPKETTHVAPETVCQLEKLPIRQQHLIITSRRSTCYDIAILYDDILERQLGLYGLYHDDHYHLIRHYTYILPGQREAKRWGPFWSQPRAKHVCGPAPPEVLGDPCGKEAQEGPCNTTVLHSIHHACPNVLLYTRSHCE